MLMRMIPLLVVTVAVCGCGDEDSLAHERFGNSEMTLDDAYATLKLLKPHLVEVHERGFEEYRRALRAHWDEFYSAYANAGDIAYRRSKRLPDDSLSEKHREAMDKFDEACLAYMRFQDEAYPALFESLNHITGDDLFARDVLTAWLERAGSDRRFNGQKGIDFIADSQVRLEYINFLGENRSHWIFEHGRYEWDDEELGVAFKVIEEKLIDPDNLVPVEF